MKKNFKKSLAVLLVVLSLISVMSVSASAAVYNVIFTPDENCAPTDVAIEMATGDDGRITIPDDELFTREGHYIFGWSKNKGASTRTYSPGKTYRFSSNTVIYPVWKKNKYNCEFVVGEGATASGTTSYISKDYDSNITPPGATKPGFVLVGWSQTEGSLKPEIGPTEQFKLKGNTVYYAVWAEPKYEISVSTSSIKIKDNCVNKPVGSASFDIINTGNQTITIDALSSSNYTFSYSSSLTFGLGDVITVTVTPVYNLSAGDYSETFSIVGSSGTSATVSVAYKVVEHAFDAYKSNNDATYSYDGTKTSVCLNGCGESDTIIDANSQKIYSADNNTAQGLLKEYLYHKTIRFTAYGSGCDDYEFVIMKKFVPVSWYVNDQYNGTFEAGANGFIENGDYDVVYVHDSFGTYQLKIKYVEMEIAFDEEGNPIVDENGMPVWVECKDADGNTIEDEKVFNYRVGPSEKEQQEVVMPNMIVNIIFGLFGYFFEVIQQFFG